jgi:hypothetical protein
MLKRLIIMKSKRISTIITIIQRCPESSSQYNKTRKENLETNIVNEDKTYFSLQLI